MAFIIYRQHSNPHAYALHCKGVGRAAAAAATLFKLSEVLDATCVRAYVHECICVCVLM